MGKGSRRRPGKPGAYAKGWMRIWGKKKTRDHFLDIRKKANKAKEQQCLNYPN